MLIIFKYFHKNTTEDYNKYEKIWIKNINRIIYLSMLLSNEKRIKCLKEDIERDNRKDILVIRHPTKNFLTENKILKNLRRGIGIKYNKVYVWMPLEVWIYTTPCQMK